MFGIATIDEIREICADPDYVSYIAIWNRPGLLAWMVEIEYTKFKPDTDLNDDFHMSTVKWPEGTDMIYAVTTFHKSEQQFAESILWKNGLKKVKEGWTQIVMSSKGPEQFPVQGPNVFFLENHSKGGANVIYTNDPVKLKAAHDHEMEQCQVFFDAHKEWLGTPEGEATANAYWAKHPKGFSV